MQVLNLDRGEPPEHTIQLFQTFKIPIANIAPPPTIAPIVTALLAHVHGQGTLVNNQSHHDLSQFRLIALLTSSIPFLFNETYKYQPLALLYVYNLNFLGVDTLSYTLGYFFLLILPFILPGLGIVISR